MAAFVGAPGAAPFAWGGTWLIWLLLIVVLVFAFFPFRFWL